MKFFLVRYNGSAIVRGETEEEALQHFGCKKEGHSTEWRSGHMLEIGQSVEANDWWEAVKKFEVILYPEGRFK